MIALILLGVLMGMAIGATLTYLWLTYVFRVMMRR